MYMLVDIGSGTKIEINEDGKGPTVVLIHGWPVTAYHWRSLVPALKAAGYHAVAITLRGLGGRSKGNGSFDKLTLAQETKQVLQKLGVDRYAVIGHDWGGTVAFLLSHLDVHSCHALIVEEEILPGVDVEIPSPGKHFYPKWHGPLNRAVGLAEELIQGREAIYYQRFLAESAGKHLLQRQAEFQYVAAYTNPKTVSSQLSDSLDYYRTQAQDEQQVKAFLCTSLSIPILAIGGEFAMGAAVKSGLARAGSDLAGFVCNGAGHYPAEQEAELFSKEVLKFLNCRFLANQE
ncbi:MAG: alpha/beta hydrolase [Cyanobacteria bacterium P01_D01_bin.105]